MTIWETINNVSRRVAADVTALVGRIVFLENNLIQHSLDINTEYSDKDTASGRYKTITHKRLDGTVVRNTVFSIDPDEVAEVPPKMNLKTVTVFAKDGITILEETVYKLVYDSDGVVLSETVSV